jgi:hypothetical protein
MRFLIADYTLPHIDNRHAAGGGNSSGNPLIFIPSRKSLYFRGNVQINSLEEPSIRDEGPIFSYLTKRENYIKFIDYPSLETALKPSLAITNETA